MRQAVTRGTARRAAGVTPAVAGKTGTAQIAGGRSHAWFIGYAPYGQARRRVAFAVLLENGGWGGGHATELGGQLAAEAAKLGYAQ
jgi:cell division protein FtsI/penicillin-binding protein 2